MRLVRAVVAVAGPVVLAAGARPAEPVGVVWPGVRVTLVEAAVLAAPPLMTPALPVAAVVTDPVPGPAGGQPPSPVRTGRTPPDRPAPGARALSVPVSGLGAAAGA